MTGTHWACQECSTEGSREGPATCPNCGSDEVCTFLPTEGRRVTPFWQPPLLIRGTAVAVLSPRQADVLTALCHGMTNAQIARRLYLTENTVKTHMKRIMRHLGARDRTHAVALAVSGQVVIQIRGGEWEAAA